MQAPDRHRRPAQITRLSTSSTCCSLATVRAKQPRRLATVGPSQPYNLLAHTAIASHRAAAANRNVIGECNGVFLTQILIIADIQGIYK